jgi:GNAT superfamily N-acetyltransferase
MNPTVHEARSDEELLAVLPVLKQLRPKLVDAEFVADVRRLSRDGYRLAVVKDPGVVSVAGYRELETFATGRQLYVDDLVTDAGHRGRGYGKVMLDWLVAEAKRRDCVCLELDSGNFRADAHRFYKRYGMENVAGHFSLKLQ